MNAPATTVANPNWFRAGDVNRPRVERARLHRQLLDEARATAPNAASERRAVIVNGPGIPNRTSAVEDALGAAVARYLHVEVDGFSAALLAAAPGQEDGADAVLEEAYSLAERLRDAALRDGVNVVIDTNFTDAEQAISFGHQLADSGYDIDVIDIQNPAAAGDAAQRLAGEIGAVTTYRRYVPQPSGGSLALETSLARVDTGAPLVDAAAARARAAARAGVGKVSLRGTASSGRGD